MNPYQLYQDINLELDRGSACFIGKGDSGIRYSGIPEPHNRRMRHLKIGIYAGSGTSHSWLWFVDMFEKMGFHDLVFLDEITLKQAGLKHLDILVISGGDTFAVAESLAQSGADTIRSFVENGGVYIGSCAGAYLPMNSSKAPLNRFNFVDVKITNLSKTLPPFIKSSCKFCTSYGCDFVFHPVREQVRLKPAVPSSASEFIAPMYGGPGMTVSDPSMALAVYNGFTDKTSFLVDETIASKTLTGHAAIVRSPFGKGCFYLFGPHLEHPDYPEANKWVADAILWETGAGNGPSADDVNGTGQTDNHETLSGRPAADFVRNLKRELSNSRIVAGSLEFVPISWLIGKKVYEPEKFRVFLESMWKRIKSLEKQDVLHIRTGMADQTVQIARQITVQLRHIKTGVDTGQDTLHLAISAVDLLHQLSISFFDIYFQSLFQKTRIRLSDRP
ncbi:MAG: BPL-N domain-containing protein [Desulfatirhabdiaceae bacterium]